MKRVDLYGRVRHAVVVQGMSRREAARIFGIDRRTVDKMLVFSVPPGYRRKKAPARPKLDPFVGIIDQILETDTKRPKKQRHTSKRIKDKSELVEHLKHLIAEASTFCKDRGIDLQAIKATGNRRCPYHPAAKSHCRTRQAQDNADHANRCSDPRLFQSTQDSELDWKSGTCRRAAAFWRSAAQRNPWATSRRCAGRTAPAPCRGHAAATGPSASDDG